MNWIQDLKAKISNGEKIGSEIPESVKEVSYDKSGNIIYTYNGKRVTEPPEQLFAEGETGFSVRRLSISGGDDTYTATLFHKDENGLITGRLIQLEKGFHR